MAWENIATWNATDTLRFKAGLAYTRSVFREGPFAGNDVPLVSRWTGSAGVSWDIYKKYLTVDAVGAFLRPAPHGQRLRPTCRCSFPARPWSMFASAVSTRAVLLVVLGAEPVRRALLRIRHQLDRLRHHLPAVGTYNAYPLPGRTVLAKAGMTW